MFLNPFKRKRPKEGDAQPAGEGVQAAAAYPDSPPPKVKAQQQSRPAYLSTARPNKDSALRAKERNLANVEIASTVRKGSSTKEIVRDMGAASPDLSAAITSYVRAAITAGWVAAAYKRDGTIDVPATETLQQVLTWVNFMTDPEMGFDSTPSLRSACETWARELMLEGAAAGELVLSKALLPDYMQPVAVRTLRLYPSADGRRVIPKQSVGSDEVSLDIPSFFMVYLDRDVADPYPVSPIEPAQQAVLFAEDFLSDIRRIVKKALHPRLKVTIDHDKFMKSIPQSVLADEEKFIKYRNDVVTEIEGRINGLEPEDVLVVFDTLGIEVIDHGNTNLSNEYKVIQDIIDAKMSTGAKVMPTALGHSGTSNTASTESVLFVKYVEGAVQFKLNEIISKMLTLAVRLFGHDVYVDFAFNTIELRPDSELESFRSMKQSRVLDLLSLGLLSDEQASLMLTGRLPPAGYKKLSGTMFRAGAGTATPAGDGYNGASNGGSALNKSLDGDAPQGQKGGRGKQESLKQAEVVPLHG